MSSEQQLDFLGETEFDLDTILDNLDRIDDIPKLWPKTLAELMIVVQYQLSRSMGIKTDEAYPVARDTIAAIAHHLGGHKIYLPRDERLQRALRDIQIYQTFNGSNQEKLADLYGLTYAQICSIIAQQTKLHRDRIQPSLFS